MERLKTHCELYSTEHNDDNYVVMLRNNFRSNPDILHIPSELFYKGQLRVRELARAISTRFVPNKTNVKIIINYVATYLSFVFVQRDCITHVQTY